MHDTVSHLAHDRHAGTRRQRVFYAGKIILDGYNSATIDCAIREMAEDGASIRLSEPTPIPERVKLYVSRFRLARDARVVRSEGRDIELEFTGWETHLNGLKQEDPLASILSKQFHDPGSRDEVTEAGPEIRTGHSLPEPPAIVNEWLEAEVEAAVDEQAFNLNYQPIVNLTSGQISGFEALLRWTHPVYGIIPPATFIPVCERVGVIDRLGEWVVARACREAAGWPESLKVAVNLSPLQFSGHKLIKSIVAALADVNLPPSRLELEITESALLDERAENIETICALRRLGVKIAIDDFGTGYASLGYLKRFEVDKIKLDRMFIRDLPESTESLAIVRAVGDLGKSLGLVTLAEGIETHEQLATLMHQGFEEGQGYFFSHPRPSPELKGLLTPKWNGLSRAA